MAQGGRIGGGVAAELSPGAAGRDGVSLFCLPEHFLPDIGSGQS